MINTAKKILATRKIVQRRLYVEPKLIYRPVPAYTRFHAKKSLANKNTLTTKNSYLTTATDMFNFLNHALKISVQKDKQYPDLIRHINKINTLLQTNHYEEKFTEFFFEQLTENDRNAVTKFWMLQQLLANLATKMAVVNYYKQPQGMQSYIERIRHDIKEVNLENIRFSLGLLGKETEPFNEPINQALRNLATVFEVNKDVSLLYEKMQKLWQAAFIKDTADDISTQLFYADIVYDNLPTATKEIEKMLNQVGCASADISNWFNVYTWLGADKDGRPYDSNLKTTSALLLAGIHSEAIGAGAFADYNTLSLSYYFKYDYAFHNYVKYIAYALMNKNSYLINTSPGNVVDEKALANALCREDSKIIGAARVRLKLLFFFGYKLTVNKILIISITSLYSSSCDWLPAASCPRLVRRIQKLPDWIPRTSRGTTASATKMVIPK